MAIHYGSLPLMTPKAFQCFLPAWLIRSLSGLNLAGHDVLEFTLYTLAVYFNDEYDDPEDLPDRIRRLRTVAAALTTTQGAAIRAFLELVRESSTTISDWDRESITAALDHVWRTENE